MLFLYLRITCFRGFRIEALERNRLLGLTKLHDCFIICIISSQYHGQSADQAYSEGTHDQTYNGTFHQELQSKQNFMKK